MKKNGKNDCYSVFFYYFSGMNINQDIFKI